MIPYTKIKGSAYGRGYFIKGDAKRNTLTEFNSNTTKLLNVEEDDPAFDTDIGMLINNEFMTLQQLGIGPKEGFSIHEADVTWEDFSTDKTLIETVKAFIYLKVRMIFDPPASSVVADAYNSRIRELEWRLNIQAERTDEGEADAT